MNTVLIVCIGLSIICVIFLSIICVILYRKSHDKYIFIKTPKLVAPEIVTTNNIFMVWVGKYPKINYITQIKNAINSFKYHNPGHNLYLFSNIIPANEVNCAVLPINLDKGIYKNTPVENINFEPEGEHLGKKIPIKPVLWSDMFRCIMLWKYGGSYIDVDDICIRPLPTKIFNILPSSALENKTEMKEYNGGISSNHFNYKWRFGVDPILNVRKGNLFLLEILKNMPHTRPEEWGQILPTKIFKSNIEKWSEFITPTEWSDLLYHPKHDGHTNFDKRYDGPKIRWDEKATDAKIETLLTHYRFPLVKNHDFSSDTYKTVLGSLIKKNTYVIRRYDPGIDHDLEDIPVIKRTLNENLYSFPENTKESNTNWVIPQLISIRMIENGWIDSEILKVRHLVTSDGAATGISNKDAHIFMRHEPKGHEPRKDIDLFLDGNYQDSNKWKNRYYIPWAVMSYELRSQLPDQLLIPLGKQTNIRKTKFCCFMFRNIPKDSKTYPGAYERYQLYQELNKIRKVDRPGFQKKYPRNIFEDAVLIYKPYQFVISYENTNIPGYITEKIINSFLAGSIPIYYGTDHIYKYFNKDSFIYANDFSSRKELIQYILKVADDPNLLSKYLNTPPCTVEKLNDLFRIWRKGKKPPCIGLQ